MFTLLQKYTADIVIKEIFSGGKGIISPTKELFFQSNPSLIPMSNFQFDKYIDFLNMPCIEPSNNNVEENNSVTAIGVSLSIASITAFDPISNVNSSHDRGLSCSGSQASNTSQLQPKNGLHILNKSQNSSSSYSRPSSHTSNISHTIKFISESTSDFEMFEQTMDYKDGDSIKFEDDMILTFAQQVGGQTTSYSNTFLKKYTKMKKLDKKSKSCESDGMSQISNTFNHNHSNTNIIIHQYRSETHSKVAIELSEILEEDSIC